MGIDSIQAGQALQFATEVQTAVQSQTINLARVQGQQLVRLIQAAGSVNQPHQGQLLDVQV